MQPLDPVRPVPTRHRAHSATPAVPASLEARVYALATRQHGVVARRQILELGVSRRTLATWLRRQRLRALHRGVYLMGAVAPPWAMEMAALLACGDAAVLSHWTAARTMELAVPDGPASRDVWLILPPDASGHRRGVRAFRTSSLPRSEVRHKHGMPVTAPARTLLDLAAPLSRKGESRQLEQLVAVALERRLTTEQEMREVLERHPSHRGAGVLRRLLQHDGGPRFTRSEAEERLLSLLRSARLPLPQLNVRVAGYEVDCCWRKERLVVEVDGYEWHSSRQRFQGDRRRDGALHVAGFTVLRFTWHDIKNEPCMVVGRIGFMLGRLSAA